MKQNISRNDRGFSLVELLIAITMLGIIAAPLLHAFVTSAMTARRSYDMGELTLAAQTAAETVEADTVASIAAKDISTADSVYTYTISDVGGKGKFDAVVTLDPAPYAAVNTVDITQYSPMDAVFSQPGGASDPDVQAKAQLRLDAEAAGGTLGAITRLVTLKIDQTDAGYTYACTYAYTAPVSYPEGTNTTGLPASLSSSMEYSFYSGKLGVGETELTPLYFFFTPTGVKSGSYNDHIVVLRTGSAPVTVFLAAQDTGVNVSDAPYKALVDLRSDVVTGGVAGIMNITRVYSNIPRLRYDYHVYVSQAWYEQKFYTESLVTSREVDRMFDVTIEIRAIGSADTLYTLHSSKLD